MEISEQIFNDRKSLYLLVWAKPADVLAADLRLSELALIARCIELKIPRPMAGYWRAVAKGNAPSIPPLPPLEANTSFTIFSQIGLAQPPQM